MNQALADTLAARMQALARKYAWRESWDYIASGPHRYSGLAPEYRDDRIGLRVARTLP